MRTAQNTDHELPRKELQSHIRLSTALGLAAIGGLLGCRSHAAAEYPSPLPRSMTIGIDASPRELVRLGDAHLRRSAVPALRDSAQDADVRVLVGLLDDEDVDVAADAALALAVCDARGARGRLVAALPPDARPEVVAAAALGLGSRSGADAERGLLSLARRPERPALVPGALFSHYRWRGRPVEPQVADPALLTYAGHPEAEGRAGLCHYARAVKDPVLVPLLIGLCADSDAEVRQAAAIALAPSPTTPWPEPQAARALARLEQSAMDPDAHVVVAACRALSGFDRPQAVAVLREALRHDDFNVRVAAIEGLSRRKAKDAAAALVRMAREDQSVSVRGAAAVAVAALDPALAHELVAAVLEDSAEFVRASGCELLTAVEEAEAEGAGTDVAWAAAATQRLVVLAASDPHVRVRHTALAALEGREGHAVHEAVRRALAEDDDPVVVAVACGVAAADGMDDLLPLVRAVLERFPDRMGADARQGALDALATFGGLEDAALMRRYVRDANPSVGFAAQSGLAALAGSDVPSPERAGVRNEADDDFNLLVRSEPVSLLMETSRGTLRIDLDAGAAPYHVAHVVAFAQRGGYDGLSWHRVVPDFVIQGGCPRGDGSGSAGVSLPLEPTRTPFERGVLGMPRSSHPDSGGCQLFLMHSRAPHLDVHYTAFGRVVEGLDVIDRIDVDDRILRVRVVRRDEESR